MLQCSQCEFCTRDAAGNVQLTCNPLTNIKEPECLAKWQLLKLDVATRQLVTMTSRLETMVQAYQATLAIYRRLAPMQEKMFRHMQREIDEIDEADKWKLGGADDEDDPDADDDLPR